MSGRRSRAGWAIRWGRRRPRRPVSTRRRRRRLGHFRPPRRARHPGESGELDEVADEARLVGVAARRGHGPALFVRPASSAAPVEAHHLRGAPASGRSSARHRAARWRSLHPTARATSATRAVPREARSTCHAWHTLGRWPPRRFERGARGPVEQRQLPAHPVAAASARAVVAPTNKSVAAGRGRPRPRLAPNSARVPSGLSELDAERHPSCSMTAGRVCRPSITAPSQRLRPCRYAGVTRSGSSSATIAARYGEGSPRRRPCGTCRNWKPWCSATTVAPEPARRVYLSSRTDR